ncbi:hypothetical protein QA644_33755 (plasmid) [Rhizobium sp. CC1099]|uniref:hypothetical protein n=1 Tax=Rhizobium sp. CC1099 TaxID=3039160 RepID=UPI0024B0969C|nr:hypothetical protein [Rhizobium sp. CC1099]WFU92162.1 hypothetical protein QA644_33755 [Rhizobium sp. CC1099]
MSIDALLCRSELRINIAHLGRLYDADVLPPAFLKDFDRSQHKDQLYADWHLDMDQLAGTGAASFPAAFSAINPPAGSQPKQASPEWTGMPRTIKRIIGPSIAAAAKEIDEPREIGAMDPVDMRAYDPFRDSDGEVYEGPLYRSCRTGDVPR